MRPSLPLLIATFLACLSAVRAAIAAPTVTFTIADATDPAEVTEDTTVFIDGRLVAHFQLGANRPYAETQVTLPQADSYEYALCGRITIRVPDGHTETHVLDDGATLVDPNGRRLEALAADGFTTFYLGERLGPASAPAPKSLHRTNVCSIPVS